jgi:subtilase family serine protease
MMIAATAALASSAYALPDLVPTSASATNPYTAGTAMTVSWTVENQGDATAGGHDDQVWFSTDAVLTGADTFLGAFTAPSVAAGNSYNMSRNVNVPSMPEGTYYMIVSVDGPNSVAENSNANNVIAASFQIVKPDLVPTSASATNPYTAGTAMTVSWTVENQGNATAGGHDDQVWFSTDAVLTGADTFLGVFTAPSVTAGNSYNMARNVNVPNMPEGTYYMIVSVDGPNNVDEISNGNNVIAAAFQIVKPDLVPTSASATNPYTPGNSMTVSWTVENQGMRRWRARRPGLVLD